MIVSGSTEWRVSEVALVICRTREEKFLSEKLDASIRRTDVKRTEQWIMGGSAKNNIITLLNMVCACAVMCYK